MTPEQIRSARDFWEYVEQLVPEQFQGSYEGSLEEYLRSLWSLIQQHREEPPSFALFARLLRDAFDTEPVAFEDGWLAYTNPPEPEGPLDDFEYLRATILFQIADLRRMEGGQLDNEWRYFGVPSPTENYWYNFDPFTYLKCAAACLEAWDGEPPGVRTTFGWSKLADFLEAGRIYE
jgi:hypothetical protein